MNRTLLGYASLCTDLQESLVLKGEVFLILRIILGNNKKKGLDAGRYCLRLQPDTQVHAGSIVIMIKAQK